MADRRFTGDEALIVCDNLVKIYKVADLEVVALQGLDLLVEAGEFIALVGASGSGKSTLVRALIRRVGLGAGSITITGNPLSPSRRIAPGRTTPTARCSSSHVMRGAGPHANPRTALSRHNVRFSFSRARCSTMVRSLSRAHRDFPSDLVGLPLTMR